MDGLPEDLITALSERSSSPTPSDHGAPCDYSPLTDAALDGVALAIGAALPSPLRQIYRIANGGFGPGYGFFGLVGGAPTDEGDDALGLYRTFMGDDPDDPTWAWSPHLLPVLTWGCAMYSCVDLSDPEAAVVRFDPNAYDGDWGACFHPEASSLREWLTAWLDGHDLFCATAS